MPEPANKGYRVEQSKNLLAKVKSWTEKCARMDRLHRLAFANAFKTVLIKLEQDPLGWGEQERTLPEKELPILHGAYSILSVYYTVLEEQRTVVIKDITMLSSFPLETGPDETA